MRKPVGVTVLFPSQPHPGTRPGADAGRPLPAEQHSRCGPAGLTVSRQNGPERDEVPPPRALPCARGALHRLRGRRPSRAGAAQDSALRGALRLVAGLRARPLPPAAQRPRLRGSDGCARCGLYGEATISVQSSEDGPRLRETVCLSVAHAVAHSHVLLLRRRVGLVCPRLPSPFSVLSAIWVVSSRPSHALWLSVPARAPWARVSQPCPACALGQGF